jgi:hypothetical protein
MSDINANHHRFAFSNNPELRHIQRLVYSKELTVDFESNVGKVLIAPLLFGGFCTERADSTYAVEDITYIIDSVVRSSICSW